MKGVQTNSKEIETLGTALLKTGTLLMSAGANTGRVRTTVNRIAEAFGYSVELHISQRAITLTIMDEDELSFFSRLRRTPPHVINFQTITAISTISWLVIEEQWTIEQYSIELKKVDNIPHFPRWMVLLLVGMAGAGFCALAEGSAIDMLFTFIASTVGLFVRQESVKANFNPYLSVYFAAFTASLIAGLAHKLGIGDAGNHAFVTSVLFLIPGVPLINSFSDIIDGNIQNGITRGFTGLILSFTIALGMLTASFIYQF
jgi:uncharacterized membrane protein YjjP (DUF1212 family)